jgi:DNA-binding transcriptional ArsR family regulator
MASFGPTPTDKILDEELESWAQTHDTRHRIKQVTAGIREPKPASHIAERAQCSPKTARKHLEELVDERIVSKTDDPQGARYRRNEEYFAWRRAHQLSVDHSEAELLDQLGELDNREEAYQNRFNAELPANVEFPPENATHDEIHELWEALTSWETLRNDIQRYREALRLARKRSDEALSAD